MRAGIAVVCGSFLGVCAFGSLPTRRADADTPKPDVKASASASGSTIVAKGVGIGAALAIDDTALYWLSGKKLSAVDKAGGTVRTVSSGNNLQNLTMVHGKPFWSEGRDRVYALLKPPKPTRLQDLHVEFEEGVPYEPTEIAGIHASASPFVCLVVLKGTAMMPELTCFDPAKPANAVTAQGGPTPGAAVALDDKNLYYTGDDAADGAAMFVASYKPMVTTLGKPTKLVALKKVPDYLTASGGGLFWFDAGLVSLSLSPPSRTVLAAGAAGSDLVADATHVYFRTGGKIVRVARVAGSKVEPVAGAGKVESFALDGTSIYFIEGGNLIKASKG